MKTNVSCENATPVLSAPEDDSSTEGIDVFDDNVKSPS